MHVTKILSAPVGHKVGPFCHAFTSSYIVSVNDQPVFHVTNVLGILHSLALGPSPHTIKLELAPECCSNQHNHAMPLHLHMHDLQWVCALQSVAGEGMSFDEYHNVLDEFAANMTSSKMSDLLTAG